MQVRLEERDASSTVLSRWVPLGLAVAHAVRCAQETSAVDTDVGDACYRAAQITHTLGERTETRRRGIVRKWATTNFDSGETIAPNSTRVGTSTYAHKRERGAVDPRSSLLEVTERPCQ